MNLKRGYETARKVAPYAADAVRGYLTNGVAGAVAVPAERALRQLLPDTFTNNRAKRRAARQTRNYPLPEFRGLRQLEDRRPNPLRNALNGYQVQRERDAARLAAVHNVRFPDNVSVRSDDFVDAMSEDDDYSVRTVGGTKLLSVSFNKQCYGNSPQIETYSSIDPLVHPSFFSSTGSSLGPLHQYILVILR